jgi:RND superfamily putative drug exporter
VRSATAGERVARLYASIVVGLRYPIVLAWLAATVLAVLFLPQLGGSGSAPISDIVPSSAKSVGAEQRALRLFGSSIATDVVVVQRNPRGLTSREVATTVTRARDTLRDPRKRLPGVRAALPLVNAPAPGVRWGERNTTALTYLFLDPGLNLVERDQTARRYAATLGPPARGSTRRITGAGPARLQQFDEIDRALPWVTVATILVIIAIVALYFRSVGAPLVTLATAALAYVIAVRVLAWGGERAGVTAPSEIEPVLVVLLLGLVTDYTVFFLSETRRRLLRGERRVPAARGAATRIAPIVLTAGVLVAAGAVSLLAGKMEFFRVFGPGLALCALVVTLICVTLVPALMALLGPWLFGRRVREAQAPKRGEAAALVAAPVLEPEAERREKWRLRFAGPLGALRASRTHAEAEGGRVTPRFITRLLTARPVAALLSIVVIAVLVLTAAGARSADLAVSFIPSLPKDAEARQAGADAARGFVPGVLSPTDIVVEQGGIARRSAALVALQRQLQHERGVAVVLGPSQSPGPPLQRFVVARGGGAVRYAVLLDDEPTGANAIATITRLQDRMPAMLRRAGLPANARVSFAGETALAKETVDAMVGDLRRVAVAMAVLTFVLLALFLRSLVAPLLLLVGSVLAFAASFGLTALLLPRTVGGTDFIYYVPLVAAVLLVGLGSDYNVFIAGRVREEAQRRRHREAVAVGAPSASRAITVAGVTLAATFALLALVPLRPFRELALLMSIGVLIDALLVRPLLIPTMIAAVGRFAWWPGTPQRPAEARAFLQEVAERTGDGVDDARAATRATLSTLSERIPEREVQEMARHLPEELLPELDGDASRRGEVFGLEEFVERVAQRSGTSARAAWDDARAVISTVIEALPEEEVEYVRAALSEDYRPLFGDAIAPASPGAPASDHDRLGAPRSPASGSPTPPAPPPTTVG